MAQQPDYSGRSWALYNADTVDVLHEMPANSIHCAIYSPPFSDLFVYSQSERDMGNCASHDEFMEHYGYFARELHRVMMPGRVVAVHCSDLPKRKSRDGVIGIHDFSGDLVRAHEAAGFVLHGRVTVWKDPVVEMTRTKALGLLYKQLKKDSAMSRPGMADYVLMFRKDGANPVPITHSDSGFPVEVWQKAASPVWWDISQTEVLNGYQRAKEGDDERHICPLQLGVIRNSLALHSRPGEVVLDPFNGIGSTGFESVRWGRYYVGTELKPSYAKLAAKFLADAEASQDTLFDVVSRVTSDAA